MHGHANHAGHAGPAQQQLELMDLLRLHAHDQYTAHTKACFLKMQELWQDLETEPQEQRQTLEDVMAAANETWDRGVADLADAQAAMREAIQAGLRSIGAIKQELGADDAADAQLHKLQGNRSAHRTLRAWFQDVTAKTRYWECQRQARLDEHEDLQGRIRVLRQLCGLPAQAPSLEKPDISKAAIEFLKLELERLATEKERREDLLRQLLDDLVAVCAGIGEDAKTAAAEVHSHLVFLWDADAARVMRDVYRLGSSYCSSSCGGVDLSDSTISRLGQKLAAMRDLKASREAHAVEMLDVLSSLWEATDVPPTAPERAHFERLMTGPLRLHAASLETCMDEVRRLEDVRAQQMVDLVVAKGAELRALCRDSHVEEPAGLQEALRAIESGDNHNPGAAAELLAKLLHMIAECQVVARKRSTIVAAIREVEGASDEEEWLLAYEADPARYKGRDANAKLQRAIRAGKLRDRLPALVDELAKRLQEWRQSEGGEPFLFDGVAYEDVLGPLAVKVHEAAAARAAKAAKAASNRRQSGVGVGSATTSPSAAGRPPTATPRKGSAGMPPRPLSGGGAALASPAPRKAGGPATPNPLRGVSSRSLSERHSISVIRDSGRDAHASGPAALSRSGEVRLSLSSAGRGQSSFGRRSSSEGTAAAAAAAAASRRASLDGAAGGGSPSMAVSVEAGFATPPRGALSSRLPPPALEGGASPPLALRASTSDKLSAIFARTSVQHAVARPPRDSSSATDQGLDAAATP